MKSKILIIALIFTFSITIFEFQDSFAVRPTLETTATATSPGIGGNTLDTAAFTISAADTNKLLVYGISMRQTATSDEVLTGVELVSCSGAAGATTFTNVLTTDNGNVRTEIWILDDTPVMSVGAGDCEVRATLSAGDTFGTVLATAVKATAAVALYSDVDQTNPISANTDATGTSTLPTVSINTNEHNRVFNAAASTSGGALPAIEAGQDNATILTRFASAAGNTAGLAISHADGMADPAATSQGWTLNAAADWAISAVAIRSTSDDNVTADNPASSSSEGGNGDGGCGGDCTPPTLGVDEDGQRLVEGGFTYNGQTTDVELFYTPFPLITTTVGEQNIGVFKIFENQGLDKIYHLEFVFGLRSGEIIGDSMAKIIWDKTWDGVETVTLDDPDNVFSDVDLDVTTGKCREDSPEKDDCLIVTISHTFRKPLDFDIVGTSVWDNSRNQWSNYFNHGVRIVGDSLDPPPTTMVAFGTKDMRGLYELTQLDSQTETWVDEFGNVYKNHGNNFFEKISTLKQGVITDYVDMHESDAAKNIINEELADFMTSYYRTSLSTEEEFAEINNIHTIEYGDTFDTLSDPEIIQTMNAEESKATALLYQECTNCADESFAEISETFHYTFPDRSEKLHDPKNQKIIQEEYNKAFEKFNKMYGYIYNDDLILVEPAVITYVDDSQPDKKSTIQSEQSRAQKIFLEMYGTIVDSD